MSMMPFIPSRLHTLRAKILGLLALGIISVGLIAFYSLSELSEKIDRYNLLITEQINASLMADSINLNFKRQVQEWKNVLLRGHETEDREKYWQRFLICFNQTGHFNKGI